MLKFIDEIDIHEGRGHDSTFFFFFFYWNRTEHMDSSYIGSGNKEILL